jgi:hypothetical protein
MGVVLRFGYAPLRGFIETIGAIVLLLRRTIVSALTPPFNYGPELVDQFLFALRLGWFPMILASLAFTYEPAGIEVDNFLNPYPTACRAGLPATSEGRESLGPDRRRRGVTLVGMEATGVYWKTVFQALEDRFECWLLNAHHLRNVRVALPRRRDNLAGRPRRRR